MQIKFLIWNWEREMKINPISPVARVENYLYGKDNKDSPKQDKEERKEESENGRRKPEQTNGGASLIDVFA